ncbi:Pr6Pr family membrane protein [Devosia rhodophyticola]|uniref:Pr6Pr family membrane protein n=1 Tax=Devosia rhodophyticola TaxID=3026423 RepID=A0ABY7YVS4_9HYPH|nr:Pr6Pr family membrane protein [Devosia rhodophyticola]WDR05463.1 Pr6Pr family membrane protein [Devosia rhodophyticola]
MAARRLLTLTGLLVGTLGLVVQFVISMQAYAAAGRDIPGALGMFLSYYTILTNIIVVLIYLSEISAATWLSLFRHPVLRGLMAANIALVMLFVFFVLRHLTTLEGLFLICDYILHYVAPVLYIVWWSVVARHGALRFDKIGVMLAPTLVYFFYAMARGAWVEEYPYPILNAINLGYGQVLLNAVGMTVGLGSLMALTVLLDNWLGQRQVVHD